MDMYGAADGQSEIPECGRRQDGVKGCLWGRIFRVIVAGVAALAVSLMCGSPAFADDDEIVVYGDLFARWDGTRWSIDTEVMMPGILTFQSDENLSMRVKGFQLRSILACDKEWKLTRSKWEVSCKIESMGIQVAAFISDEKRLEINKAIIDEIQQKLEGASVQLQVKKDGRVTNIQLEGVEWRNRREQANLETLRQLLKRMIVGYDMKLRKNNFLSTGQWVEYQSPLLELPGSVSTSAAGMIIHQLDRYKGHLVVQTVGKGSMKMGVESDTDSFMTAVLQGVSIYDEESGFMTERVWYLMGTPTAATLGGKSLGYWHAGRLRMLDQDEQVDVGPTRQVSLPTRPVDGISAWESIEASREHASELAKPPTAPAE